LKGYFVTQFINGGLKERLLEPPPQLSLARQVKCDPDFLVPRLGFQRYLVRQRSCSRRGGLLAARRQQHGNRLPRETQRRGTPYEGSAVDTTVKQVGEQLIQLGHRSNPLLPPGCRPGVPERRWSITGVTGGEVPDQERFLRGGELILTSLYAYRAATADALRLFVETIDDHGAAALAFKPGRFVPDLPALVLHTANERSLPLVA